MSFPAYESYKDSGSQWLGQVPATWEVRRLRNVARLNPSKSEANVVGLDTELSFLPMEAIGERGELDLSRTRPLGEVQQGYSFFADGDVVFAKVTPCFENGKGAVMSDLTLGLGFGTTELTVIRPNDLSTVPFLWWFTYSRSFRDPASAEMVGAGGLKRVPDDYVNDCAIPWPPLSEQHAIAAFLDRETAKIDALVEAQRQLIELLKEKRQAVISHAVTKGLDPSAPMKDSGVEWLGQVPAHWEVSALKRSWSVTDCKHITAEFVEEGVPVASIREVQARFVDLRHAKQTTDGYYDLLVEGGREPTPGDLIFSRNATVGEVSEVSDRHPRFAMGQDVCLLRRQDVTASSAYLYHVIRSQIVQEQLAVAMIGSTFKRVNVEEIRNLTIPVPPQEEQVRIADHVEGLAANAEALVGQAEAAITLLQERRAALISAAVTGKIDVRGLIQTAEAA